MSDQQLQRKGWDNVVVFTDANGQPDYTWNGEVKNLVYDTGTMEWVAETQSGGGGGGDATAANQTTQITLATSTNTKLDTINTTLGSPFQAGGSIANTAFGISGTLPAFAATPTVNIGTTPVNTTGSGSGAAATVSTVDTITAPASAVGFILMNLDTSTTNMRWAVGRTASATLGQQLQPGRDSGFVPVGADISIIAESGTCNYDVQWVSQ